MKANDEKFSEYRDKIYNLLWSLKRNKNMPDMHSFKAFTKDAVVWVEYDKDHNQWWLTIQIKGDKRSVEYVNPAWLANQLAFDDLDLESVEF